MLAWALGTALDLKVRLLILDMLTWKFWEGSLLLWWTSSITLSWLRELPGLFEPHSWMDLSALGMFSKERLGYSLHRGLLLSTVSIVFESLCYPLGLFPPKPPSN